MILKSSFTVIPAPKKMSTKIWIWLLLLCIYRSPYNFLGLESCFMFALLAFKIKVSIIFKIIQWNYQFKTKKNWPVCELQNYATIKKIVTGPFEKQAPAHKMPECQRNWGGTCARVNPVFVEKKLFLQSGNLNETNTSAKSLPTQLCIVWNHPQLLKEIYLVCTICTLIKNKFNNGTCTLNDLQAD